MINENLFGLNLSKNLGQKINALEVKVLTENFCAMLRMRASKTRMVLFFDRAINDCAFIRYMQE
jgi:hypothetical protein